MKTLSLCMITKNEEKNLSRCLDSIKDIVDEIIIVDTGSTDKTVEIAKSYGAHIYHYDWNNDFSKARNVSLQKATKDWILVLDADEVLPYEEGLKLLFGEPYKNKQIINNNREVNEIYNITFTTEKYHTNTTKSSRRSKGSHHNYIKENETKIAHGKVGEKIVLKAEQQKLKNLGFNDLINEVKIVAEVNDEITLDGLGYDIISYNELKERICIEVKTAYGTKDKPFFITQKEIDILEGLCKEYDCKYSVIYYVLIDGLNVKIKTITQSEFNKLKKEPYLYIVK